MIAALAMTALSVGAALEIGLAAIVRSRTGRRTSTQSALTQSALTQSALTQAALPADGGQIPTLETGRR